MHAAVKRRSALARTNRTYILRTRKPCHSQQSIAGQLAERGEEAIERGRQAEIEEARDPAFRAQGVCARQRAEDDYWRAGFAGTKQETWRRLGARCRAPACRFLVYLVRWRTWPALCAHSR